MSWADPLAAEPIRSQPRPLDLTDPRTVRAVARRAGLQSSRRLGQHFLVDRGVLEEIVAALNPSPQDDVLEIGCGLGTLTGELARHAARVVAVDVDPACVRAAQITQHGRSNVTTIRADARSIDPAELGFGAHWMIAGNLPYQLTGVLLNHFFELPVPPNRGVFLVQREVAARLCAESGDWSLATVAVRSIAHIERLGDVTPSAFEPAPAVHSSIVRMTPARTLDGDDRAEVLALARSVFQARRKTLRNAVARALGGDTAGAEDALRASSIDSGRRAGTLHLDEWQRLARSVRQVRRESR